MSKEPKRMQKNILGASKAVVYMVVAAIVAVVIISYILLGNIIGKNKNEEKLAKNNREVAQIKENKEDLESASSSIGKTVEESKDEVINEAKNELKENNVGSENITKENNTNNNIQDNTKDENVVNKNSLNTEKETNSTALTKEKNTEIKNNESNSNKEVKKEELSFTMPVEGEIIRGFAKDNLVYSDTLQEWVVHKAIDIKAESKEVVKASEAGTVLAIKNDPRYGLTVIIEHGEGFKTVYSNLLTAEFVVEGEKVKKGQTLGTIGSSASFEISDESHLHFEILKDSEYVDPSIYLK